jgi:Bacterial extracellular solute-binding protein.
MLVVFAACSADDTPDANNTAVADGNPENAEAIEEAVDERYRIKEELPTADYEGYNFRMFLRDSETVNWLGDMYVESMSGEVVDDAVYNRNRVVSEKFNVKFSYTLSTMDDSNGGVGAANVILAGDDAYDIVVPHARLTFTNYAQQKLLLDWNTDLLYVDLDKPWWDQDAKENLAVYDKLYAMTGDISYQSLAATNCMLFNKNMFTNFNLDFPYQSVVDGTWTFDEFEKLAVSASSDLNGDGEMNTEQDRYGYVTYQWIGPIQVLYTSGGRIMQKDSDGNPVLSINTPRNINVFERYFNLLDSDTSFCAPNANDAITYNITMFREGRAMFIDMNLKTVIYLRDMEDDYGIIPWPKFDESTEKYFTNVDAGTNIIGVPITNTDPERTSVILEALCAEGYREVIPAYYEVALQGKYSRDDVSVQMLDIIRSDRVFDLGYYNSTLSGAFDSVGYSLVTDKNHDFASFYAKNETSVMTNMEKVLNDVYR